MANDGSASGFSRTGAHSVANENWGCSERYGGIPTSGLFSNVYYCTTSGFLDLCTLSLVIFNSCSGLHLILWLALKERYPSGFAMATNLLRSGLAHECKLLSYGPPGLWLQLSIFLHACFESLHACSALQTTRLLTHSRLVLKTTFELWNFQSL
jgi:hypothetical protein